MSDWAIQTESLNHNNITQFKIRDVHCRKCQVKLGWFNEFIEDTNQVTPQISEKKISYKISVSYKQFQQYKEGRSSLFSKSIACRNGIESEKCEATLNFETRNPSHGIPQAPRFNWTSSDEDSDNSPNSSDSEPENFMPRWEILKI